MAEKLVIVESPAKARTIGRFLGDKVQVQASLGHVRDLPEGTLGVDIVKDFKPDYELTQNGRRVIKSLRQAAAKASDIYLATDPDREGEAIAWHLQEALKSAGKGRFHRVTFHEITRNAIERSFAAPGSIAYDLVDAQQARRVLDRLVGYQVSPLLWRNIQKGTSAGRVQSVALRLVVEREREIQAFKPEEYWNLDALFAPREQPATTLKTRLTRVNDEKAWVASGADAERLATALEASDCTHRVAKVASTPRRKNAAPPFITSTLQQAAGSAMKMGATQTMRIAQDLYEGIELGSGGPVGLITYMRTDSVQVAKEAQEQARAFIAKTFGNEYVPDKPNTYSSRKSAQGAHEAIRPTDVTRTPESLAQHLSAPQLKIYRLIWNRFVASQMAPARQMDHVIEIESAGGQLRNLAPAGLISKDSKLDLSKAAPGVICTFRASARETLFPGYLRVYNIKDIGEEEDPADNAPPLPALREGMPCLLKELLREQNFTTPPSRYSEASLVKALEQNGVGRPSTYATTVNTIQERDYVNKDKGALVPTDLGCKVNDYLVQQMPELFDIGFTAQMESRLDEIEEGNLDWVDMLKSFYAQFQQWLGNQAATKLQESDSSKALLALFHKNFPFNEPVVKGPRTYDDKKFVESLRKRLADGKALTDRQNNALLVVVARYAPEHPDFLRVADEIGLGDAIREQMAADARAEAEPVAEADPQVNALIAAMKDLSWNEPVKRGNRTYDDGKFYKSLAEQAASGKALSPAQVGALTKMAAQYAAAIPNYQELIGAITGGNGVGGAEGGNDTASAEPRVLSAEEKTRIETLLAMADSISEWQAPSKSGRRTFDDRKFVESLRTQYEQKGSLSERQVAAFSKVVKKYAAQIPGYAEKAAKSGLNAISAPARRTWTPRRGAKPSK
ncbi:MAG: type I DNA topoisomerase [Lentisphaeria bacterium]|jgi:DNA topoisomerase-1